MISARLIPICSAVGLSFLVTACAAVPDAYPPPTNPFLAGASPLQSADLAQPTKVGLVWLAPDGSPAPPQAAQRRLAEKVKAQFAAGKRLEIVGTTTIAATQGDMLVEVRKASAPFNVNEVLVVMPKTSEVISPVWLTYGRDGRAIGTRTDSFVTITMVAVDLTSGKHLFSVVANGDALLLAPDHENALPFYPRISPGYGYTGSFIYPEHTSFPAGEVHAVALEQAVNGLIYKLDRALGS
jgi:hypothetical protein